MRMKDIENREDLVLVIENFYKKALKDAQIGHFFTQVIPLDLEVHLPVIVDFWEYNLFHKGNYNNNLLAIHQHINNQYRMTYNHIDTWVKLLHETVDHFFKGSQSERLKTNALSIATVMKLKIAKDC